MPRGPAQPSHRRAGSRALVPEWPFAVPPLSPGRADFRRAAPGFLLFIFYLMICAFSVIPGELLSCFSWLSLPGAMAIVFMSAFARAFVRRPGMGATG